MEILVVLIGFAVVLEVAWRFWKLYTTGRFPLLQQKEPKRKVVSFASHPYCLYRKRPGCRGLYPANNLGYTGVRDYETSRAEASVRIMVIGGSTVEDHDHEAGPDSSWPAQLEDILNERFGSTRIEVINAGVSGYTSVESMIDYMLLGVETKPDILLVYHGVNDVLSIQMTDGFKPDYTHVRQHKSWEPTWVHRIPQIRLLFSYEFLRSVMIDRFGRMNTILDRVSSPPWQSTEPFDPERVRVFKRNTANLVALAKANESTPVIVKWECDWETDGVYPWTQLMEGDERELGTKYFQYIRGNNAALKDLSSEQGCKYLEVGPFAPYFFKADNLHFTAEGLKEMAGRMATAIEPLVQSELDKK